MRVLAVAERLRAECPALKQVLAALSAAAAPKAYPAAYVLPLAERAAPNEFGGAHLQKVTARVAVELMVKHAGQEAGGAAASESLEDLRDSVLGALLGWSPGAGFDTFDFASGRLVSIDPGFVVWRDEFDTNFHLEKP